MPTPHARRAAVLLAAAAVLVPAPPASAHTDLTGTSVDGGTLAAGAQEVVLRVRGEVRAELSTVVVTGPDGRDRAQGRVQVRGGQVVQPLAAPLSAGAWTLAYRVVAADGHPLTGSRPFRVVTSAPAEAPAEAPAGTPAEAPAAPAAPTAAAAPVAPDSALERGRGEVVVGGLAAGTVVLGALAAAARLRRRRT